MNHSPLLAAAYEKAWNEPVAIGDGVLALLGIDQPTTRQAIGATAIGEFIAHFNAFCRGLGKK